MLQTRIKLWENEEDVVLDAYVIENSSQYRIGEKRPAVIVIPGGGFGFISDRESEPVALAYAAEGFHTFVLRYSIGEKALFPKPLLDTAKAVQTVREHADEWLVDTDRIVLEGTSAGGYLAVTEPALAETDIFKNVDGLDTSLIKPNAVVTGYPVLDFNYTFLDHFWSKKDQERREKFYGVNQRVLGKDRPSQEKMDQYNALVHITENMVPVFAFATCSDEVVPALNTIHLIERLNRVNVPVEGHIFGWGPHAYSLANLALKRGDNVNPHVATWFDQSVEWLHHTLDMK